MGKFQGETALQQESNRKKHKCKDSADPVPHHSMKNIDHFQIMVFLQYIDFITISTYTSRKEQIIEHPEIVKLKVIDGRKLDPYSLEETVQADRIENFGNIEKQECQEKVPKVGLLDDSGKFCNVGFLKNQINGQSGDKKLEKWLEQLFQACFIICQRSF